MTAQSVVDDAWNDPRQYVPHLIVVFHIFQLNIVFYFVIVWL